MDSVDELGQLQANLRRMKAQSQSQHERVEKLKRELQSATEEVRSTDHVIRKQLLYYARKDCLQLAKRMHQKLPLELRELIYEYLCVEPDRPIPVGPYYHFRRYDRPFHDDDTRTIPDLAERVMEVELSTSADGYRLNDQDDNTILPDGRVKEVHTHKPPSDMILPYSHFLDPRYIGPEIASEIQKMYYTRNTFSVCSVEQGLYYFLECDSGYNMVGCNEDGTPKRVPKELELQPPVYPRDHIRNLQVRVKFEQFYSDIPKDDPTGFEQYAYEQRFLRFTQTNLQALEGFLKRRHRHGINIEFVIFTDFSGIGDQNILADGQRSYLNFLQCIRNIAYTMIHDCDDIIVKITHHDEWISAFPRDITGLFGMTKEQWEHEKKVHEHIHDWGAKYYLAVPGISEDDMGWGFLADEVKALMRQRWGMDGVVATRARHSVSEGRYWPTLEGLVTVD